MRGVDPAPWVEARFETTQMMRRMTLAEELESLCRMFGQVTLKGADGLGDVRTDAGGRVRAVFREIVAYMDEYGAKPPDLMAAMRKAAYGSFDGRASVNFMEGGT